MEWQQCSPRGEVTAMALPASSRCKAMMGGLGFRSNRGILDRSLTSNGSKRGNEGRKMRRNRWLRRVSALGPKPNFRKLIPISWSGKDRSPSPLLFFLILLKMYLRMRDACQQLHAPNCTPRTFNRPEASHYARK